MRSSLLLSLWGRALLLGILVCLLGLTPLPRQVIHNLEWARLSIEAGSQAIAADYIARVAGQYPWRSDLWRLAGRYALQGGDPHAAAGYFEEASRGGTLEPEDWIALGDAYQAGGELQAATAAWLKALEEGGPGSDLYPRLLLAHRELGDYPAIIADLRALVSLQPQDAQWHYQLGLYLAATEPDSALVYLERAVELDPELAATSRELQRQINSARSSQEAAYSLLASGRVLANLGEWELAGEAFRRATLARPDYAEAWAFLGEALQQLNPAQDSYAGLQELQAALERDPDSLAANVFMALFWQRKNQYDQALDYLNHAAGVEPDNPVVQAELGKTQAALGDLKAAHDHYLRAIELAPRDPAYWRMLAEFSIRNQVQVVEIALPAASQALELAPGDVAALDLMGQVYFLVEDFTNARSYLESAIQADPGYAPAHLHLGVVYLHLGDTGLAYQLLDEAREMAPGTPVAEQAQRLLDYYFP